jgi:hypothetical protein
MYVTKDNTIKSITITLYEAQMMQWKRQELKWTWIGFGCAAVGILAAISIWGG